MAVIDTMISPQRRRRAGLEAATFSTICAFVFAVPWASSFVLPVLGTSTRVIGLMLVGIWLASILAADRIRPLSTPHRIAFAWVVWAALGVFWTVNPSLGFLRLTQYVQLFAFTVIVWDSRLDRRDLAMTLQCYLLGCWVAFFLLLANVLSGNVTQWQRRASLENTNENEVGLMLALGLTVAWYLASGRSADHPIVRRLRPFNYLFVGAGFLGIMYTASRGSFLAVSPFIIYLVWSARNLTPRRRASALAVFTIVVAGAYRLVPETAWDRIGTIPSQLQERDLGARFGIWSDGLPVLTGDATSFLFGQGPVSFLPLIGKAAHNIWLSVAVEAGVVGLLLFASLLFATIRGVFRLEHADRNMWLSLFATYLLAAIALSLEYNKITWLLLALALAHADLGKSPGDGQSNRLASPAEVELNEAPASPM